MIRLPVLTTLAASLLVSSATLAAQSTSQTTVNQSSHTEPSTMVRPAHNTLPLKTDENKVSYSIGVDLGENFKAQGIDVNPSILAQGLKDAIQGKPALTKSEMQTILKNFQEKLISKKQEEFKQASLENKQEGDKYLAANKKKAGVHTTDNGIEYKVIKPGSGEPPHESATVTVEYTGTFTDGTIFDRSEQPVTFPINNVIPGWTKILKLMKPGSTFEVAIPPQLAYGEHGVDKVIGPNKTLLFTIHLVDVKQSK